MVVFNTRRGAAMQPQGSRCRSRSSKPAGWFMWQRQQQVLASGLLLLGAAASGLGPAMAVSAGHASADTSKVIADPGQVMHAGT